MTGSGGREMLLGRQVPVSPVYDPGLLYPIARDEGREQLGLARELPFHGADYWHAYELSWLDPRGKPVSRLGRFTIPADSPCLVESKSLKLYLNSLNNSHYESDEEAIETIRRDVGAAVGAELRLELFPQQEASFVGRLPPGRCLDGLPAQGVATRADPDLLAADIGQQVEEQLYSHLLRSLCPVTGQPDWATLWIHYRGPALDHEGLLRYIISFRDHQEFHEQCVERMFLDILRVCRPRELTVQALYTRRGGLDICPLRSTLPNVEPLSRMSRQ